MRAIATSRPAAMAAAAAALGAGFAASAASRQAQPAPETAGRKPKVTYFDGHGRAFVTRVALRTAKVDFDDERLSWKQLSERRGAAGYSADVPLGQLPTLTLPDGTVHTQSQAIARWAGKKSGLYPKDEDKALVVDEVAEVVGEMLSKLPEDKDNDAKKAKRAEYLASVVPRYLDLVAKRIERSGGPFVLGKQISLADLYVYRAVARVKAGELDFIAPDAFDKWTAVIKCYEATGKDPVVAAEVAPKA